MRSKILTFGKAKKYFVFPSLNRTFEHTFEGTYARQSKLKNKFFICFVLTYSYLCTQIRKRYVRSKKSACLYWR